MESEGKKKKFQNLVFNKIISTATFIRTLLMFRMYVAGDMILVKTNF